MTEPQKKGIEKSVVITLGVLVVIFAISNIAAYISLQSQISSLQYTVNYLEAAQLYEVNLKGDLNEPLIGSHYIHVYGAVFNSGTNTASDVKIDVQLFDSNNVLMKSYTINLGSIIGKTYANVDTDIDYSGHCANYTAQIWRQSVSVAPA